MTPLILLLSLVLHAYHVRNPHYHHSLLVLLAVGETPGRIRELLRNAALYFLSVTAMGSVRRAIEEGETRSLYLPALAGLLAMLVPWYPRARGLACVACALGLHGLLLGE